MRVDMMEVDGIKGDCGEKGAIGGEIISGGWRRLLEGHSVGGEDRDGGCRRGGGVKMFFPAVGVEATLGGEDSMARRAAEETIRSEGTARDGRGGMVSRAVMGGEIATRGKRGGVVGTGAEMTAEREAIGSRVQDGDNSR